MPPPIPHFRNPVHACLLDPSSSPTSACRLSRCSCVLLPLTTCYCLSPPATASHHLLLALAPSPPGPGRHAPACLLGPSPNSLVHYPPPPLPAGIRGACLRVCWIQVPPRGIRPGPHLAGGARASQPRGVDRGAPRWGQARATRGAACWATRGAGQGH